MSQYAMDAPHLDSDPKGVGVLSEVPELASARLCCPKCMAVYRNGFEACPLDGTPLEAMDVDPLVGTTIADQYVVDKCVGEGAMGRVYLAHHVRLTKRNFAMKVLLGDLAADPTMRLRFGQEAEAASRLQHPNVVSVLDYGETDGGLHYLVMDFIEGGTLCDRMEKGAMSEKETIGIAKQICEGLIHAHEQGLIHRDFKPDNVALVERDGKLIPQILDFGLAIISTPEESSVRLTSAGLVVGTPAYVSPEQCQGKMVDLGTDLFALGVSLYEMVAGMLPFDGSVIDLLYKNTTVQAPPILERSGIAVSAELEAIIMRLMEKARGDRFKDARELLAALDAIEADARSTVNFVGVGNIAARADNKEKLESAKTMMAVDSESGVTAVTQVGRKKAAAFARTVPLEAASLAVQAEVQKKSSKGLLVGGVMVAITAIAIAAVVLTGGDEYTESPLVAESSGVEAENTTGADPDAGALTAPPPSRLTAGVGDASVSDDGVETLALATADAAPAKRVPIKKESLRRGSKSDTTRKGPSKKPVKANVTASRPEVKDPVVVPKPPVVKAVTKVVVTPTPVAPKVPTVVKKPKVPTSFKANAKIGSFSSRGPLSTRVARRAVDRVLGKMQKCYEPAAKLSKKNSALSLKIKFTINEQGRSEKVKVSGASLQGLKGCIEKLVKKVKPKSLPDVGTQSVEFVLKYTPKP